MFNIQVYTDHFDCPKIFKGIVNFYELQFLTPKQCKNDTGF